MKYFSNFVFITLFAALSLTFNSCENSTNNDGSYYNDDDLLYVIQNSMEYNNYLGCTDSIKLVFNKKINLTKFQLDNAFDFIRTGDVIELDSNRIDYEYDTLTYTYRISSDSLTMFIKPSESIPSNYYMFYIYYGMLNGTSKDAFTQMFDYHNSAYTSLQFTTKSIIPNDILPENIMEINGKYQRKFSVGDTTYGIVPYEEKGYRFLRWENYDNETMFPNGNVIKVIGTCNNMRPWEVHAIYEKIK